MFLWNMLVLVIEEVESTVRMDRSHTWQYLLSVWAEEDRDRRIADEKQPSVVTCRGPAYCRFTFVDQDGVQA